MELIIINNTLNLGNTTGPTNNLLSELGTKLARFTSIYITPVVFMFFKISLIF